MRWNRDHTGSSRVPTIFASRTTPTSPHPRCFAATTIDPLSRLALRMLLMRRSVGGSSISGNANRETQRKRGSLSLAQALASVRPLAGSHGKG